MKNIKAVSHNGWARALSLLLTLALLFGTLLPAGTAFAADTDVTTLSCVTKGADGRNYRLTARYGEDAAIPADAVLTASAIAEDDDSFEDYAAEAMDAINAGLGYEEDVRLFDIAIVSAADAELKYQPAEGSTVELTLRMAEAVAQTNEFCVVHFGEETEVLASEVDGRNVSFETDGFSVYAFVDLATVDAVATDETKFDETPLYLSITVKKNNNTYTYYMCGDLVQGKSNTGMVITRTEEGATAGAVPYYFEKLAGTTNHYYIYKLDGETKKYIKITKSGSNGVASFVTSDPTEFTVSACRAAYPNQFLISCVAGGTTFYLNLRKDENGNGFNGSMYSSAVPETDSLFSLGSNITAHYSLSQIDTLGLDGNTYGLCVPLDKNMAGVLTAEAHDESSLAAQFLPIRANPLVEGNDTIINVNGDIDLYTFHKLPSGNYYLSTVVGGATKYLRLQDGAATLTDTPDEYCAFKVLVAAGAQEGQIRLFCTAASEYLTLYNSNSAGQYFYGKSSSSSTAYFRLCQPTFLGDDDFVPYTAIKVSVSDRAKVHNGSKVVVYTRLWNESAKQYEFYAIDHDGSLVRCYDEGDTIRWAGTQINTMLWDFTEYYYWPYFLQIPNYYYELRNTYSGKYIAPQYHTGQILSDRTIGINLNGRRFGDYYSTILAWDDARYDYAGIKASADHSAITAVPMSKAQDFYFAIMDDPEHEYFPSVDTVDNNEHGITMKLVNFQGQKYENDKRDRSQTDVMGDGTEVYTGGTIPMPGLVTTDLDENGYPVATHTDKSLEELFGSAQTVNHLFLQSTYDESGYFEYNCTQTYATLLESGNFRVYNQIGTVEVDAPSQGHGWFMPYNDIDPSIVSSYTNSTDVQNNALASNDPRLGETLYGIPLEDAQYHFGMQMEASFIQSKNGLDAWGHDIIFEFTGDDDMWLYVDGELVLDLGGVHSALVGTINFRTGEVSIPVLTETATGKVTAVQTTTSLYEIFKSNYETRNPEATPEEVQEHLDRIFTEGETPGSHVFKDYSSHTMQMFYMERGAGASNLHMRFNLTTAVEGQLLLKKTVSGTDKQDYASARFPYQIWYYDTDCAEWRTVSRTQTTDEGNTVYEYVGATYVYYEGSHVPVEYEPTYTIDDVLTYDNVFFLKPGETAEIQFPSDETEYYIKECAVNTNIYDAVTANDVPLTGVPTLEVTRSDFSTQPEVIGQRKVVTFDNHVSPNALRILTITKKLFDVNYQSLAYPADTTGFRFRVYIGNGTDKTVDGVDYGYYRMDSYYVKDHQGYYCWYNYELQQFESLGKSDFSQLTEEDLDICTFTTSPSGAIDKIPADHSVEIRNLLVDTVFYIEERESDIPKGYDLIGYERAEASYIAGSPYNCGTIRDNADPHLIVNNHRGWGLTVQKYWSDANFMLSHDNIYFAVFCNGHLVTDPDVHAVRRMKTEVDPSDQTDEAESSLYFYFKALEEGAEFSDYTVKEVALTDPVVDGNGYVTSYGTMTILGDGEQLVNGGIPQQTNTHGTFYYSVTYETGTPTGPAENVRTDTVTNSRPGVKLVKTDGNGDPLRGAVFTLTDGSGANVLQSSYTSDAQGLITFAYPEQNVTYTLTEVTTPDGYSALLNDLTFTLSGTELTVDDRGSNAATVTGPDADGMITISVKNYETEIKAIKEDEATHEPIRFAHFALYRQVIGKNGPMRDYYPMTGYTDLVTGTDGVIPKIDGTLPQGTYYLHETTAPYGYFLLDHDIIFTVTEEGTLALDPAETTATLSSEFTEANERIFTLHVPNRRTMKSVELTPQTLVADYGLAIEYDVTLNNHVAAIKNAVYTYIGVTAAGNVDPIGTVTAPELLCAAGETYQGRFGTFELTAAGIATYRIDTMKFTDEDTFWLVAHVTEISGEEADVYCYESITFLPATTVYYEDDFGEKEIETGNGTKTVYYGTYVDGEEGAETGHDFGAWSVVTSGAEEAYQAADLANTDSANIFGYDPHYTNFAAYSNNSAHKVSVSTVNAPNQGGAWPYMEFDFAGTGFDLISVSAHDTGVFTVRVYKITTDPDTGVQTVSTTPSATKLMDTYYGYHYGRIYADANGAATLSGGTTLYDACEARIAEAEADPEAAGRIVLKASGKFLTTIPTYYDDQGVLTETPWYVNKENAADVRDTVPAGEEDNYDPNYAYAEGWLLDADANATLYQIPVIRIENLDYGTYRAHIEPRYASNYGHHETLGGYDYFDLYVDALRIYDPANEDEEGNLTSEVIGEAYDYSSEAFEKFTTLKNVIVGTDSMGEYEDPETREITRKEGAVLVDGGQTLSTARIQDYVKFGPKNELYLSKNMSVAFRLCATTQPADLQIQLKRISDAVPTLKVVYVNDANELVSSATLDISSATDLSYSVMGLLGRGKVQWTAVKRLADTVATGLIIVSNVGEDESLISITNLKWTFRAKDTNLSIPDGSYWVSLTPRNAASVSRALSFSRTAPAAAQPETVAVETPTDFEDGKITLTVTTDTSVQSLIIRDQFGNPIDEAALEIAFADLDDGERQWTVTVANAEEGSYTFLIYKQGAEFTDGTPIRVDVRVDLGDIPDPETPSSEEPSSEEPSSEEPSSEEPGTEEPTGQEPTTDGGTGEPSGDTGGITSFLQKLRGFWLRFTEMIKRLLSYIGVDL